MRSALLPSITLVTALVLAGCVAPSNLAAGPETIDNESVVFDQGSLGDSIVAGGLDPTDDGDYGSVYATTIRDRSGLSRVDFGLVNRSTYGDVPAFIDATDFENETLVVFQQYPGGCSIDHYVDRVVWHGSRVVVFLQRPRTDGGCDGLVMENGFVRIQDTDVTAQTPVVVEFGSRRLNATARGEQVAY